MIALSTTDSARPAILFLRLDVAGRVPAIAVTLRTERGGSIHEEHARISAAAPSPNLAAMTAGVDEIVALDVLEHTRDEERWLAALAALANPGARLTVRVPRQSALTWLDGFNAYRYLQDVTGRGRAPRETRPTGWHRHYTEAEIVRMIEAAGFRVEALARRGVNLPEPPRLAALVAGDWLLGLRGTERHARAVAGRLAPLDLRLPAGSLSTRIVITATREDTKERGVRTPARPSF